MGFWEQATDQAGREFGSRFWRWFAGVRVARRVAPPLLLAVLVVGIAYGVYAGYRWLSPDWASIGSSTLDGSLTVGKWILLVLLAVVGLAGGVLGVRALWRAHSWRWSWRWSRY